MLRQGVLPEDATTELLNGLVVLKDRSDSGEDARMHGPRHRLCIRRLTKLAALIDTPDRHAQIQLPLVCGDEQMPEPDFAVIQGSDEAYSQRLPSAAGPSCVVEVADSSYERDSEEKLPVYAAAGMGQYLIVNLRNETVEHYADPDPDPKAAAYRSKSVFVRGQSVAILLGQAQTLDVTTDDLLP